MHLAVEGRVVVAGVITRFEYHLCKTLCTLRYVDTGSIQHYSQRRSPFFSFIF